MSHVSELLTSESNSIFDNLKLLRLRKLGASRADSSYQLATWLGVEPNYRSVMNPIKFECPNVMKSSPVMNRYGLRVKCPKCQATILSGKPPG